MYPRTLRSVKSLANKLSEELQLVFQNPSRPISRNPDQEQQVMETLSYYFPQEEIYSLF